jgi:23S rRNA pseudouridine2604 synthase
MRLNKYLGESGVCSRREADALIAAGRVTLNGVTAVLGTKVGDGDEVRLDGRLVGRARKLERPVYIALNKPVGITCTTDRRIPDNIVDFVDHPERIFMIGRLDKMSEGLILLTNDGDIVNEVLRAGHGHEKQYIVTVERPVTDAFVAGMAAGVQLEEATTNPCKVRRVGPRVIDVVLTQGLNRQIRRMCEALGYRVTRLERVRIMHIRLGNLPRGRWRNLTPEEVKGLAPPPERQGKWQPGRGQ